MKKKFDEEFPKDEDKEYFEEPEPEEKQNEPVEYDNTVELSDKGFSQNMVQQMNQNQLKIAKIKLKNLRKEKKGIKQYLKENQLTKGTKETTKTKEGE